MIADGPDTRFRARLRGRAGRVGLAGQSGGSGDARRRLPQGGARPALLLPAGEHRRRRLARPLFHHRDGARPHLALRGGPRRHQCRRAHRAGCLRPGDGSAARQPARAPRPQPARPAARPATDGGRPRRLSRLRHGAADGAAAREEHGCARRPRGDPHPPDRLRGLRQCKGHADARGPRPIPETGSRPRPRTRPRWSGWMR